MITFARPCSNDTTTHDKFLSMLPAIRECARFAFRAFDVEAREELIAEVVANAYRAFVRLVECGKENIVYSTPLAWYAIKQVRCGRRVGGKLNVRDISSRHAQRTNRIVVERLDEYDAGDAEWKEIVVEDRHAGPAETAAARIDVSAWFRSLASKKRRIAQTLAKGETTGTTAKKFKLSDGRVSQLRRELEQSWTQFQGEVTAVA